MKTPLGLLGAALLLWAWPANTWWFALPLLVAFEASAWIDVRWDFSQTDLDRLWNICAGLILLHGLYLTIADDGGLGLGAWVIQGVPPTLTGNRTTETLRQGLRLLPLWLAPMMLVQVWGRRDRLPASTFSWFLRRRRETAGVPSADEECFDISWAYFVVVVTGASTGDYRPELFIGLILLVAWAIGARRSRAFAPWTWGVSFAAAAAAAVLLHAGLRPVGAWWNEVESNWLNRWMERHQNPSESQTSLGAVGRRQNSGRIAFRLEAIPGQPLPTLLAETVHDTYRGTIWKNTVGPGFLPLPNESGDGTFTVVGGADRETSFRLWLPPGPHTLVPQPFGLRRMEGVRATAMTTNGLGVLRATDWKFGGVAVFQGNRTNALPAPGPADLTVPEIEAPVLAAVVRQLGLDERMDPAAKLNRIRQFFAGHFGYTLYQSPKTLAASTRSTLEAFLLRSHRGHCEYFATATTLLLRYVGIPARYVVGWAVPMPGPDGPWTLIRDRHAHAWTLAFIDGRWREVDHTPATEDDAASHRHSAWEMLSDSGSSLLFTITRWRYEWAGARTWLLAITGLLLAILILQWFRGRNWRRHTAVPTGSLDTDWPGLDSEFFALVRVLELRVGKCGNGETLRAWFSRIPAGTAGRMEQIQTLLELHYRLRFDPHSLSPPERSQLRSQTAEWLNDQYPAAGTDGGSAAGSVTKRVAPGGASVIEVGGGET